MFQKHKNDTGNDWLHQMVMKGKLKLCLLYHGNKKKIAQIPDSYKDYGQNYFYCN